jgi:bacteriorhodopsin
LVTTVISSTIASDILINIVVVGCVVFAVLMVLSDERRRPALALLSRHVTVFMIPLLSLFAYIAIIWGAKILAG